MNKAIRILPLLAVLAGLPATAAWEELRRNDSQRLSIDPASIKRKGDEVSFRYLVDFREKQGDFKTAEYRSLTVKAAMRCKARTIALRGTEVYEGQEAKGPSTGVMRPSKAESAFKPIEAGTSDEELHARLCKAAPAKAATPAKK
jgi:tRNA A37 N6-isopentenylltransferase MiaA